MTAAAGRPDLRIWLAAGVVALAVHAAVALRLIEWHNPVPGDDGSQAVLVDLAPMVEQPQTQTEQDLAPGPEQQEAPPVPEPPKVEQQQETQQMTEPLPDIPNAEAVLPKQVEKPVEKVEPEPKPVEKPVEKPKVKPRPPAPATTAPPRPHVSAAQASNWHRQIAIQLERSKSYPAGARAQGETGAATVSFSIGRDGRVLSSRLVQSSHVASLDEAALTTVHRAAPFPPPPAGMPGTRFDFTVPIRFNIR